ncbi:MAG TPA: rhodanese-like domain-containing protein [Trebonia sp.]|nr:rhodanese-like domain-containing protein [Trebonia sp.]
MSTRERTGAETLGGVPLGRTGAETPGVGGAKGGGVPLGRRSIDEILAGARDRLVRVSAAEAHAEAGAGAVLVDIRPASQREADGEIPGSWVIERNHLEWRLDPASDSRLPWVSGYDHRIIVFCQEGYTSSLAAAALLDLGLSRSTDLVGGYRAWVAAGLPTAPAAAHSALIATGAVHAG